MSLKTIVLLPFLFIALNLKSQTSDSLLVKRTTISGFSLCYVTTNDLQKLSNDFKEVEVEEMDLSKDCFGQDSRFIAGKGLFSEKFQGMIFQKQQTSDKISKIRLTKGYIGKLPDGKSINLNTLLLKDLFIMYPQFKENWNSRGCSNYWKFSNDTMSFYVKIDPKIKPQFPINEMHYLEKPIEGVDLVLSCYGVPKENSHIATLIPTEPIYYVDSVRATKDDLMRYEPTQIASVTVYREKSATEILGNEGKHGLIYIETKPFAKSRYWKFLSSKSEEYKKLVPEPIKDDGVIYILNGKVLKGNFEGDLASIDATNFIELQIINKETLKREFGIKTGNLGVRINIKPTLKTKD